MSYCLPTYIMSSQWVVSLLIPFYFNLFNNFENSIWVLHLHHFFHMSYTTSSSFHSVSPAGTVVDCVQHPEFLYISLMCILPKTIFIDLCSLGWGGNKLWIFTIHLSATCKQVMFIPDSKDEILENIFPKQSIIKSWIYAGEFLKCLTCANRFRHIGYSKIFGWF